MDGWIEIVPTTSHYIQSITTVALIAPPARARATRGDYSPWVRLGKHPHGFCSPTERTCAYLGDHVQVQGSATTAQRGAGRRPPVVKNAGPVVAQLAAACGHS